MLILAALQAFILVLIVLTATFAPSFVRSIYHDRLPERAALVAFLAFIAYELFAAGVLTIFFRRGRNFPVVGRYMNALVETSFPTVLLYLLEIATRYLHDGEVRSGGTTLGRLDQWLTPALSDLTSAVAGDETR